MTNIKSHVIDSPFTDEEVKQLKDAIYSFFNSHEAVVIPLEELAKGGRPLDTLLEQEWSGRALFVAANTIPNNLKQKIKKFVKEHYDERLEPEGFAFTRYAKKYGEPRLAPHYDTGHAKLTVDYQLESNTSWDLVVEDKVYTLSDNSALVFKPSYEVHWRVPKLFNDDEYVDMIFFHFHIPGENEDIDHEEHKKIEREYQDIYKEDFKKLHGWCYWHGSRG